MRRFSLAAIMMIGLVGSVLAVSVWTMHRAGRASLRQFRAAQARLAQDTASSLQVSLDSFDRDTRLLAKLAAGTRKQTLDANAQDDVILAAFQALATVVPHYRTIALFHAGRPPVVAIDPTEDKEHVAPTLVAASRALAAAASDAGKPVQSGPLTVGGGRAVYLYAAPVSAAEAVVVTSDAALVLEAVSRRSSDAHGLIVIDPNGAAWIGCERRERCRLVPAGSDEAAELLATIDAGTRDERASSHPGVARLGLPSRVIVGAAAPIPSPLGVWSVVEVAPAADLDAQEKGNLHRLVLTSVGVMIAMLAVGLLILRQQSKAAGLRARLQAAEEVARLQRQLVRAEKLVTVGVLSAGIAHEIGTPLAVVRGRAEHMLERRSDPRDVEDLQAVIGEIDHISSTIRQVLDFSREQPVTALRTDARAAVDRAVQLLKWRLAGKHVHVEVDAQDGLPAVAAAADQLEQVLLNLLLNACDASRLEGSIRVVMRDGDGDRLRIEVIDQGAGIPPHYLNAVFDPYFTTKKRGEGTGLGLAIVAQIVRAHRGEISLRSTVGVGTVATVLWPTAGTEARMEGRRVA